MQTTVHDLVLKPCKEFPLRNALQGNSIRSITQRQYGRIIHKPHPRSTSQYPLNCEV